MTVIEIIRVVDAKNIIRQVCVVESQPFYLSSGTSIDPKLKDIWLPFKGFGATIVGVTGMFHKPDIASQRNARIKKYFPVDKIAWAVEQDVGIKPLSWGRFKDNASLLITCQLSHARMKEEFPNVMSAVEQTYALVKFWEELTLNDPAPETEPLLLNEDTMHNLNQRLMTMGAKLDRDMKEDYDPANDIMYLSEDEGYFSEEELIEPSVQDTTEITSLYRALLNKFREIRSVVSNNTKSSSTEKTSDHKMGPFDK